MKIYSKSLEWLIEQQSNYKSKLPKIQEGEAKELAKQGLAMIEAEIQRRAEQKKTESQPTGKTGQVEQKPAPVYQPIPEKEKEDARYHQFMEEKIQNEATDQEQTVKAFENKGWEKVREALPVMARAYDESIKTVKAPAIDREPEYINIELTDQKGAKYIRTYNRAQTKALCRKYFSNVHNAWAGGNRKLTNGFDNLLAYFLGWAEFDGKTPGLQDVLQDYSRYKKASEKSEDSESFKVAKELYGKVISIISKKEQSNED